MDTMTYRVQATAGALLAALAVALSAWAAHGLPVGREQHNVLMACLYAFGHGALLRVLAARAGSRVEQAGRWLLLFGVVLFSGSLVGNVLWAWPTAAAPAGGVAMIVGWLLLGIVPWLAAGRSGDPAGR